MMNQIINAYICTQPLLVISFSGLFILTCYYFVFLLKVDNNKKYHVYKNIVSSLVFMEIFVVTFGQLVVVELENMR